MLDTSAVAAILFAEPECATFIEKIQAHEVRLIAVSTIVETAIVIEARKGEVGRLQLDVLVHEAQIEVVPFELAQVEYARTAWLLFGKGRHPAGLNFGDCFSYALAKATGEPLLYKGNDFARTDVEAA